MAHLLIESVTESKSGKAWNVKSGGKFYTAYKDSGVEKLVGQTIDADIETFGKGGLGIKKYRLDAPGAPTQATGPIPTGGQTAPWYMAFVSNTVAHAISAGRIEGPDGIKAWVLAAKQAAESMDDIQF